MNYDRTYENLLAAIVIQAAGDFIDAYQVGLINEDNEIDVEAMKRMIHENRKIRKSLKKRCGHPKAEHGKDIKNAAR